VKPKNLSQQFVSATLWNTLLFPARLLVGLVASVVYYQRLSLDQVGVLFLLQSLATTVGMYADLGLERTLPRFLPEVEREAGRAGVQRLMGRVIRLKLIVLLILIAGLAAFAQPVMRVVVKREEREISSLVKQRHGLEAKSADTRAIERTIGAKRSVVGEMQSREGLFLGGVCLLLLLGALFDVYMQFLTAYLKQRSWNLITLASTLLQPVLVTAFILAGWGIAGVILGLVVAPFVSALLAAWQVSRASRELPHVEGPLVDSPRLSRRFSLFAAVNYLMQVTTWVYDLQFVVFLSAATLGLADVALLGMAYKFAKDFLGYVWTPLNGVMTPILARVHVRGEPKTLQDAHATLTRIIWLIVLPAGVGLTVLTPRILSVLYAKYTDAATLIVIFIVSTFGESLLSVPHNVLMVVERYRVIVVSRVFALLSVPLVWLLLPRYGLVGVAVAVGLARVGARLVTVVYGAREMGLRAPLAFLVRVAAASGCMAAVLVAALHAWPAPERIHTGLWGGGLTLASAARVAGALAPLLLLTGVGAVTYGVVLRLLGGLDPTERRRLGEMKLPFQALLGRLL
jgi:O-antigen/teichoic acid export membrane protein